MVLTIKVKRNSIHKKQKPEKTNMPQVKRCKTHKLPETEPKSAGLKYCNLGNIINCLFLKCNNFNNINDQ